MKIICYGLVLFSASVFAGASAQAQDLNKSRSFLVAQQMAAASGVGGPCDTKPGREEGQALCEAGLVCTGPFEGQYGRGNCQAPSGK